MHFINCMAMEIEELSVLIDTFTFTFESTYNCWCFRSLEHFSELHSLVLCFSLSFPTFRLSLRQH